MEHLLRIICIASAIFVQSYGHTLQNPQVKIIGADILYLNKKYIVELSYDLINRNATNNRVFSHWDIVQDLPEDVTLESKVYVTDSSYKRKHLLLKDTVPICQQSAHRELLPAILVVDESQLNQKCIKKGVYDTEDLSYFRFEQLVPNLHKEGDYYTLEYRFGTKSELIMVASVYCEWGYLKDN